MNEFKVPSFEEHLLNEAAVTKLAKGWKGPRLQGENLEVVQLLLGEIEKKGKMSDKDAKLFINKHKLALASFKYPAHYKNYENIFKFLEDNLLIVRKGIGRKHYWTLSNGEQTEQDFWSYYSYAYDYFFKKFDVTADEKKQQIYLKSKSVIKADDDMGTYHAGEYLEFEITYDSDRWVIDCVNTGDGEDIHDNQSIYDYIGGEMSNI